MQDQSSGTGGGARSNGQKPSVQIDDIPKTVRIDTARLHERQRQERQERQGHAGTSAESPGLGRGWRVAAFVAAAALLVYLLV